MDGEHIATYILEWSALNRERYAICETPDTAKTRLDEIAKRMDEIVNIMSTIGYPRFA